MLQESQSRRVVLTSKGARAAKTKWSHSQKPAFVQLKAASHQQHNSGWRWLPMMLRGGHSMTTGILLGTICRDQSHERPMAICLGACCDLSPVNPSYDCISVCPGCHQGCSSKRYVYSLTENQRGGCVGVIGHYIQTLCSHSPPSCW